MEPELEEQEEPEMGFPARHVLTDMVIQTVGLVPKGANMQSFFLLKNLDEEETMPDDVIIEEVPPEATPPQPDEGYWKRLKSEVAGIFKTASPPDPQPEPDGESEPVPAPTAPDPGNLEKILKAQTDRFEALLKAQKAEFDQQVGELKTDLEKANARAEAAETYAAGQTEQAERREFVQKALDFKAVPVEATELGGLLYTLHKSVDEKTYELVEATLKAMDKQAWTAGLFKELGTARTPEAANLEAKVERLAKEQNVSYADALLQLSPAEQRQLMEEG